MDWLAELVVENQRIHDETCLNLNPATNRMNPRAEQMLAARLGSRASLGYPGDKYETGLEAIEQIEVIAAELAARVFKAAYAEVRVGSGALANLYSFMACCEPGDTVIAPPESIARPRHAPRGRRGGALPAHAPLPAPVDADSYTVDLDALADLARTERPRMITVGGSLNLVPHPVAAIREIADEVGATVLFDAAHLCGVIAGGAWPNPLDEGAHLMSMSTYKSLGGPPGGLLLTNDAALAERIEAIAYPGLTANSDAGRTAALAQTMLDWLVAGPAYATAMVDTAAALAEHLASAGLPVFRRAAGATTSHQLAVEAATFGGGQTASARLRRANLLDQRDRPAHRGRRRVTSTGCASGLPRRSGSGWVRTTWAPWRRTSPAPSPANPEAVAAEVSAWRSQFRDIHYTTDRPTGAAGGRDPARR